MPRLILPIFLLCSVLCAQSAPSPDAQVKAFQEKAAGALARGDTGSAISALQEGLKLKPDWIEGLWTLGWTLFREARYDAARPVFMSLLRLDQSKGATWLLLGLCEFEARDYGMALEDLQHGRALGIPVDLGIAEAVRYHTAVGLALAGRYEGALDLLEQAASVNEHTPEIVLATGLAVMRMPVTPEQAPELFGKAQLAMLRDTGEALFQGARKNRVETDKIFARLFNEWPTTPKLHHAYAYYLIGAGDLSKAETEFRAEMAVDSGSVLARCGLAYIALEQSEPEQAVQFAREAVRLNPGNASTHFLLGKSLLRAGKVADSIPELETARDIEPQSSKVRFTLQQAYREANRPEDAAREAREFERLRQIDDQIRVRGAVPAALLKPGGRAPEAK